MQTTIGLELYDVKKIKTRPMEKIAARKKEPWVAEILGETPTGYKRRFIKHKTDFTHSNSRATRGVYLWYLLDEGKLYEIQEQTSWRNSQRYFAAVINGELKKISQSELDQALTKRNQLGGWHVEA